MIFGDFPMNDFTKAELSVLHLSVVRDMRQFDHILKASPSMIALRDKLENMMDNYCEHDWRKGVHLFNDIYCTKCKKHFEVNNEA
jgi:hypothetical protein